MVDQRDQEIGQEEDLLLREEILISLLMSIWVDTKVVLPSLFYLLLYLTSI